MWMTASILSLRQDYKKCTCKLRALDRFRRMKYGRMKRYDAGACLASSWRGPDWSN